MKKRLARGIVYFALLGFTVLVLSHPHVWQSVFGPKVKGEPLWVWQEEVRCRAMYGQRPATLWSKVMQFLRLDSEPMRWTGIFDSSDPEMLPVLLGLADDGEEMVRARVARYLGGMPAGPDVAKTLIGMLGDRSSDVRVAAADSLGAFLAADRSCLPVLEENLHSSDGYTRLHAAGAILGAGLESRLATEVLLNGLKAPAAFDRQRTVMLLFSCKGEKNAPVFFACLVDHSQSDPDLHTRHLAIRALGNFGGKAVPVLMPHLQDPTSRSCVEAIWALGAIGPDAQSAIPSLEILARNSDEFVATSAQNALPKIDPKRAKK